jgi:hypothetical protein
MQRWYGCENWSELRLRVTENRMLMRMFRPNRIEDTGVCRSLHDELSDLYWSPDIIRVIKSRTMRWAEHVERVGQMRSACKISVT